MRSQLIEDKLRKYVFNKNLILPGLVLLSLFINTIKLANIPLGFHGDEAEQALQAKTILEGRVDLLGFGWYGLPIASFIFQAIGLLLFGQTIFGARIVSAIFGAITLVPFFFLAKQLFNFKTAVFSTFLLTTAHWWIAFSRLGINNIQVAFFAVLAFLLIFLGFKKGNKKKALLGGFVVGTAPYLYFAARITPLISFYLPLIFVFQKKYPWGKFIKILLAFLLGVVIMSAPIIFSIYQSSTVAFSRQNDVFIFGSGLGVQWREQVYGDLNWFAVILAQITRSFNLNRLWFDTSGQYGYQGRILDWPTLFLLFVGIWGIFSLPLKPSKLFPIFWLGTTCLVGWGLTENPPFSPRIIGALPAVYLIGGYGASVLFDFLKRKINRKCARVFIVLVLFLITTLNLFTYFIRGVKEEWGDPNKYTATKVANYLQHTGEDYKAIFITAPFFYSDFGPIRFLAPDIEKEEILRTDNYTLSKQHKVVYIIHPAYYSFLEKIIALNPNGILKQERDARGIPSVIYYQVD